MDTLDGGENYGEKIKQKEGRRKKCHGVRFVIKSIQGRCP